MSYIPYTPIAYNITGYPDSPECEGKTHYPIRFNDNYEARAVVNGITFVVAVPYLFVTSMLMWHRRNKYPLNQRETSFIMVSCVAGILYAGINCASHYYNRFLVPCELSTFFNTMWVGIQCSPSSIRVVNLRNVILWNRTKAKISPLNGMLSPEDMKTVLLIKKYASRAFAMRLLGLLLIPSVLMVLIQNIATPVYFKGCVGCRTPIWVFVGCSVSVSASTLYALVLVRRLLKDDDTRNNPEVTEIVLLLKVMFATATGFGLINFTPLMFISESYLDVELGMVIYIVTDHYIQCFRPLMQTFDFGWSAFKVTPSNLVYTFNSNDITLQEVLIIPKGLELFQEHLRHEYTVESLLFYQAVEEFRLGFLEMTLDEQVAKAEKIHETFIGDASLLQINISHELCKQVDDRFKDIKNTVSSCMFDEAESEVFRMMSVDSFPRFKKTAAYEQIVQIAKGNNMFGSTNKRHSSHTPGAGRNSRISSRVASLIGSQ